VGRHEAEPLKLLPPHERVGVAVNASEEGLKGFFVRVVGEAKEIADLFGIAPQCGDELSSIR